MARRTPESDQRKRPSTKLGHADEAECSDTGEDARGVYFPEDPQQVQVWSLEGQDPGKVIGAEGPDGEMIFFIAEDLPKAEADRISDELSSVSKTDG